MSRPEWEAARFAVSDAARPDAVRRQHDAGKLTARERIGELVDPGSFREIGALARPNRAYPIDDAPADGVVTGSGTIGERRVNLASFDFTVVGGSYGTTGGLKIDQCVTRSLEDGRPLVMLLEGGGHRIQEGLDGDHFAWGGDLFARQGALSGWVPMANAILGPGFAGPSNLSALADFVVMVRGTATMGMAGPALVRAATGERIGQQELGGAEIQADRYGIADLAVDSEAEALAAIRRFLGYLPSNAAEPPPLARCDDPVDRAEPALATLVPGNPRRPYDVRTAVTAIADRGSVFEIKPRYAANVVTCFARIGGRAAGVVANQPLVMAGALTSAACEKAAHFVALCDAFGLPLVFLVDVPGFLVGSAAERSQLARRSGRLFFELGQATVPRFTVVLRKGYGAGYLAMSGGRSFGPDLVVAWPTAEFCAMSVDGAIDVAFRREIAASADPEARRRELADSYRSRIDAVHGAAGFGIDDIIAPDRTRRVLADGLRHAPVRRRAGPHPPRVRPISPI